MFKIVMYILESVLWYRHKLYRYENSSPVSVPIPNTSITTFDCHDTSLKVLDEEWRQWGSPCWSRVGRRLHPETGPYRWGRRWRQRRGWGRLAPRWGSQGSQTWSSETVARAPRVTERRRSLVRGRRTVQMLAEEPRWGQLEWRKTQII